MPLISLVKDDPLTDGRQSERALDIRAGLERYFGEAGLTTLPELTLANGRRADLVALSQRGDITIVEIKSSVADLRADKKWPDYRSFCDRLYFATLPDVPQDIFPEEAGLIIADAYGAEIMRDAPEERMAAATRKAVTTRIARTGMDRLSRITQSYGYSAGVID